MKKRAPLQAEIKMLKAELLETQGTIAGFQYALTQVMGPLALLLDEDKASPIPSLTPQIRAGLNQGFLRAQAVLTKPYGHARAIWNAALTTLVDAVHAQLATGAVLSARLLDEVENLTHK